MKGLFWGGEGMENEVQEEEVEDGRWGEAIEELALFTYACEKCSIERGD